MGEIDTDAVTALAATDPDHALALLAEMTGATDPGLAALAARLAGRIVLDLAGCGPSVGGGGSSRLTVERPDRRLDAGSPS